MSFIKSLLVGTLSLVLVSGAVAAPVDSPLIKIAVESVDNIADDVAKALRKLNLTEESQKILLSSLRAASKALNKGQAPKSQAEIDAMIKAIAGLAGKNQEEILAIARKPLSQLTDKEAGKLADTLGNAVKLSNDNAAWRVCRKCYTPELERIGISVVVSEVSGDTAKVLASAPTPGPELTAALRGLASEYKLTGLTDDAIGAFTPSEQQLLWHVLGKLENGSSEEKKFIKAAIKFTNKKGKNGIFDTRILLMLAPDDNGRVVNPDVIAEVTAAMEKITQSESDVDKRFLAMQKWWESHAEGRPDRQEILKNFKDKNCFDWFPKKARI